MDGNIAGKLTRALNAPCLTTSSTATYTLVYHFLKKQSQRKAAEAVKKAAKDFVVLRDDIEQEGPQLEDIVKQWKAKQSANSDKNISTSEVSDSSSEDSSDDSDSSSDSDSTSSSSSGSKSKSHHGPRPESSSSRLSRRLLRTLLDALAGSDSESDDTSDSDEESDNAARVENPPKTPTERDTSATLSSAGENVKEASETSAKKSADDKSSDPDSSDSDSSDSDSSDAESSSVSSDSTSSDDEDATPKERVPPKNTKTNKAASSSSSESSSESEDDDDKVRTSKSSTNTSDGTTVKPVPQADTQVAKKRKTSETGGAVITAVADDSQKNVPPQKGGKPPRRVNERFQRIKAQDIPPEQLIDNNYTARGGTANDYGERAHQDLIVTRGAGFRKEKNKKKRGSYRGGEITLCLRPDLKLARVDEAEATRPQPLNVRNRDSSQTVLLGVHTGYTLDPLSINPQLLLTYIEPYRPHLRYDRDVSLAYDLRDLIAVFFLSPS
ncbi:SRP40, C-terminal domain-containing protein [Melanogaster broomeanus]|nr:SRP40, C-terminal domain-containing protein [Melanogaster broomeanus]